MFWCTKCGHLDSGVVVDNVTHDYRHWYRQKHPDNHLALGGSWIGLTLFRKKLSSQSVPFLAKGPGANCFFVSTAGFDPNRVPPQPERMDKTTDGCVRITKIKELQELR